MSQIEARPAWTAVLYMGIFLSGMGHYVMGALMATVAFYALRQFGGDDD